MRTQAIQWTPTILSQSTHRSPRRFERRRALQFLLPALAALLPALITAVITIWAISSGFGAYVSAAYWAIGLIYLALAVETEGRIGVMLGSSGAILMGLAWLSSRVALEFGVLAGFVVAVWVVVPILNRFGYLDLSRYFDAAN
jgi:hypothetical protein